MQERPIYNPWDGSEVGWVHRWNTQEVIDFALQIQNPQSLDPAWHSKKYRLSVLENFRKWFLDNGDTIQALALSEGAKPLADTRVEFERAYQGIQWTLTAMSGDRGESIPMDLSAAGGDKQAWTQSEAIGPVLAFGAFNHPINLWIHQVLVALAAGCPVLYKPSEKTPLTAHFLAQGIVESGLPAAWLRVVDCEIQAARALVQLPGWALFNFIGATQVGWDLRSLLAPGARCVLEHGGVSSHVLLDSWTGHLPDASGIQQILRAAFYHAGQVCISTQVIDLAAHQLPRLLELLQNGIQEIGFGDPRDPQTLVGPMIHEDSKRRIQTLLQDALNAGAELYQSSAHCNSMESASQLPPTLVWNLPLHSPLLEQEVFGPVLALRVWDKLEDWETWIVDQKDLFHVSLQSENASLLRSLLHKVPAGSVLLNLPTVFRTDWMPFGGRGRASLGLGGIAESYKSCLTQKLVVWGG